MEWWSEVEAPRRQTERNRAWAKNKSKKAKACRQTHKQEKRQREPKEYTPSSTEGWNHKKWEQQEKELRKPNGRGKCVVCNKVELKGNEMFRCPACFHRADDYLNEAGIVG